MPRVSHTGSSAERTRRGISVRGGNGIWAKGGWLQGQSTSALGTKLPSGALGTMQTKEVIFDQDSKKTNHKENTGYNGITNDGFGQPTQPSALSFK